MKSKGAEVIVASEAFGVDDMSSEKAVYEVTKNEMGMETSIASDITKLYGLTEEQEPQQSTQVSFRRCSTQRILLNSVYVGQAW